MTTDLSPETEDQLTDREERIVQIALAKIRPAADNIRRKISTNDGLKESIAAIGIQVPLVVVPVYDPGAEVPLPDQYELVAGHRRYATAAELEHETVPCVVREYTDEERLVLMLVENLQRADIDPVEEASGYFRLVECGMNQAEMAEKVGRSKKHVSQRLQLLNAPPKVLALVKKGEFPIEDALEYAKVEDPEIIEAALAIGIRDPEWSLRRAQDQVLNDRKVAEIEAKLEADKFRIAKTETYSSDPFLKEAGLTPLSDLGMKNSPKGVEGKDWLVAVLNTRTQQVTWCTDDKRAARQYAPKTAEPESEKAAKEKERAKRRAEAERQAEDDARLVLAAKGKVTLNELVVEAGELLVRTCHSETCKKVCKLLDLPVEKVNGFYDWKAAVREHVSAKLFIHLVHGIDLQRSIDKAAYAEFLKRGDG